MRINARLEAQQAHELEWLKRTTHAGTTEVIKNAIRAYYRDVKNTQAKPGRILRDTGFIGCGEADPELSATYKDALAQDLAVKHGHR